VELALNFAWMVLVTLMSWLWISRTPRKDASPWTELVALAVIILILFPVISMTDDLAAAQNLAETSSYQRKGHVLTEATFTHHAVLDSFLPVFAVPYPESLTAALSDNLPIASAKTPAVASIRTRPPPVARSIFLSFHISWLRYFL
jgi:hypothetical protein